MRSTIVLSVAALAGLSAGQSTVQFNYPYRIDPDSVSSSDRDTWCNNQKAQCPLICLQQPGVTSMTTVTNDCDPDTLVYSCVCENNIAPNITQYSQTIPFYICQEWGNQCVKGCGNNNAACADKCRADHPCGAQSPYKGNSTLASALSRSAATASATASSKPPTVGFGGATSTPAAGTGAGPATFMPNAGLGLAGVVGSIFLGFAVLL